MPKVELQFRCRKCMNMYTAGVAYSEKTDALDFEEHQSRCPFCGQWNCADPESVKDAVRSVGRR